MCIRLNIIYQENKIGLVCAALLLVYEMGNNIEDYMIRNMVLQKIPEYNKNQSISSCPADLEETMDDKAEHRYLIYLSTEESKVIERVKAYAPVTAFFVFGLLSDKYGGHRMAISGLVISGSVMAVLYLSVFDSFLIFFVMYGIRRFSEGVMWSAGVSIVGRLGKPMVDTSCSFLSAAFGLAPLLGGLSSSLMPNWKVLCISCSVLFFTASVWWWFVWKQPRFPRISIVQSTIPWRIWTTVFFYSVLLLYISLAILYFMVAHSFKSYLRGVVHTMLFEENLLLIMLMSFGSVFSTLLCGITTDYFALTSLLPTAITRKIFTVLAYIIIFFSLILMAVGGCSRVMGLASWIMSSMAISILLTTTMGVVIDIMPAFAGTVSGLEILISYSFAHLFMEITKNLLISSFESLRQWQTLFFIWFFVAVVLLLPYLLSEPTTLSLDYSSSRPQVPEERDISLGDNDDTSTSERNEEPISSKHQFGWYQ